MCTFGEVERSTKVAVVSSDKDTTTCGKEKAWRI
jgi:hypothetical protein